MLFVLALVSASAPAAAEELALGSMEVAACSKGRERATLILEVSAPQFHRVQHELRSCAEQGVAAVTLPALIEKRPDAEPAFWDEFKLCTRYTEWISAELSIQTSCRE